MKEKDNELRELETFLNDCYKSLKGDLSGKVADYIPYLAKVSPSKFAISICTVDGQVITVMHVNYMVGEKSTLM